MKNETTKEPVISTPDIHRDRLRGEIYSWEDEFVMNICQLPQV